MPISGTPPVPISMQPTPSSVHSLSHLRSLIKTAAPVSLHTPQETSSMQMQEATSPNWVLVEQVLFLKSPVVSQVGEMISPPVVLVQARGPRPPQVSQDN